MHCAVGRAKNRTFYHGYWSLCANYANISFYLFFGACLECLFSLDTTLCSVCARSSLSLPLVRRCFPPRHPFVINTEIVSIFNPWTQHRRHKHIRIILISSPICAHSSPESRMPPPIHVYISIVSEPLPYHGGQGGGCRVPASMRCKI